MSRDDNIMDEFFLCLNATKTKILVICPPSIRDSIILRGTFIDNVCIRFVTHAKNLGIVLDEVLSFEQQIQSLVKSSIVTIRNQVVFDRGRVVDCCLCIDINENRLL